MLVPLFPRLPRIFEALPGVTRITLDDGASNQFRQQSAILAAAGTSGGCAFAATSSPGTAPRQSKQTYDPDGDERLCTGISTHPG